MERLIAIMKKLRGPGGCPWDKKQTPASIKHYILEEAHEALESLNQKDWNGFREELGDLLFQVVFQSEMASEAGRFDIGDVIDSISRKLMRRHPHVFGNSVVKTAEEQTLRWDEMKAQETGGSILDRVPKSMPALMQARQLQERAHRMGFKWANIRDVKKKIHEELEEWVGTRDKKQMKEELGDLLFMVTNLARWLRLDAEEALQEANKKFRKRFAHVEKTSKKENKKLKDYTVNELEKLWKKAKGK